MQQPVKSCEEEEEEPQWDGGADHRGTNIEQWSCRLAPVGCGSGSAPREKLFIIWTGSWASHRVGPVNRWSVNTHWATVCGGDTIVFTHPFTGHSWLPAPYRFNRTSSTDHLCKVTDVRSPTSEGLWMCVHHLACWHAVRCPSDQRKLFSLLPIV